MPIAVELTTRTPKVGCRSVKRREPRMSAEAFEMVTIPRAELDSLRAEVRRLRREVGRAIAKARIQSDTCPGDDAPTFSRSQLAEAWASPIE